MSHHAALALRKAMVSSLLGGFPLQVDAIPDENGFVADGKGSQVTNHSHARLICGLNCDTAFHALQDAGPASMDAGFSTVDDTDPQTVDPRCITRGNGDNIDVSSQPTFGDTTLGLTEPLNGTSSTAYDAPGATGSTCDEGAPVGMDPNTGILEHYDGISQSVPMPRL